MDPEVSGMSSSSSSSSSSSLPDLPVEMWRKILTDVMNDDIHNGNKDDTTNCRLVCTQWQSIIDDSPLSKLLPSSWNPYFDSEMHAEGLAKFPKTAGTHFSTGLEVEEFLSMFLEEAGGGGNSNPSPNPFVCESLFVEWKSNEDYAQVLERLPVVFEKFGRYIGTLVLYFDPTLEKSLECFIAVFNKLVNLRSVTICLGGSDRQKLLDWPYSSNVSLHQTIRPDALPSLTELGVLGSNMNCERRVLEYFRIAAASRSVQNIRFSGYLSLMPGTSAEGHFFSNVDTVKVYQVADQQRGSGDCWELSNKLRSLWNIRRLSLKFRWQNREARNPLLRILHSLAQTLNHGTLQELYLDFPENSARLAAQTPFRDVNNAVVSRSQHSLTLLALPYFMVDYLGVLQTITGFFGKLTHLKLVYNRGYLGDESDALRDQVREAVQQAWPFVPSSVRWISVKFKKMRRSRREDSSSNTGVLFNVVWRYQR